MERRMERRDRERQKERGRSADGSRTPIAWQQRDMNYQQMSIGEIDQTTTSALSSDRMSQSLASRSGYSQSKFRSSSDHSRGNPANNPLPGSGEEEETGTETETETESESQFDRPVPASRPGTSGTMRSLQSMPLMAPLQFNGVNGAFTPIPGGLVPVGYGMVGMGMGMPSLGAPPSHTWDGEPCPVHGSSLTNIPAMMHHPQHQFPPMPLYSAPTMLRPPSAHELAFAQQQQHIYAPLPRLPPTPKNLHRGPPSLPPLPPMNLLPPLQRPRPLVLSEKGETERLPVRSSEAPPLPSKLPLSSESHGKPHSGTMNLSRVSQAKETRCINYNTCCRGNVVVLWSILGVIAFGIVLGVVLHYAAV